MRCTLDFRNSEPLEPIARRRHSGLFPWPGDGMFIAMNRFRITPGREATFEQMWRDRESYLDEVPGFREFHLLRGPRSQECSLYASHSVWDSHEAFSDWTESEAFRKAHAQARAPEGTYLGHPDFEGFEVVL
jgi:heme-degrading monooxygenase HmoA